MTLRSLLFVPGNVPKRIKKALILTADAVIIDLEDSVPLNEKKAAREAVGNWMNKSRIGLGYVRVNSLSTGLTFDDISSTVSSSLNGIMLSKTEDASDVKKVDWFIENLEDKNDLPIGSVDLIPLIENAIGIQNAFAIAKACTRVKRLCFGAIDYAADIGISLCDDALQLLFARSSLVNSSKAANLEPPIDTVYAQIQNLKGLEEEAKLAAKLGFQGKLVIHPNQLDIVNSVFLPSEDEIRYAKQVIEAFEKAEAEGRAAIMLDGGKFVDYPVVKNARRILSLFKHKNT